jgi:hypothetical protein
MTLRTIDRISTPSAEVFFEDYVIKRRPVVISDLFSGQAIDHVRTLDDAIAAFGRAELLVQPEYTKRLASDVPRAEQVMTFQDYWNVIRNNPQSDLVCTEYEIPAPVMQLFTLPDMCLARTTQGEEILQLPKKYGDHDLVSNMFMAGKGNKAHLHYDGDQRQVLLYQVFGEKEVVLFQPSRGSAISKAHSTAQFLSTDLNQMSRSELLEYIDKIDGYHTVIKPGEAIYMPMLIWHHLNYSEDAMSFNIRFGRNSYGRVFLR